mgnify:CR=1 FL=1
MHCMESLPYFYEQAWDLWYKEQTTCVLLLNFRTFMETPFALNSLPLRQRARWRVRSQVSWRKTCKASALYTIGIHAFFINLRNPIPLQIRESPPFATPDAKSCFCFPSLWQSKRKKPNFFAKNDSGKTLAEVTEKTLQDQRGRRDRVYPWDWKKKKLDSKIYWNTGRIHYMAWCNAEAYRY